MRNCHSFDRVLFQLIGCLAHQVDVIGIFKCLVRLKTRNNKIWWTKMHHQSLPFSPDLVRIKVLVSIK
jgi:hypothetical protein